MNLSKENLQKLNKQSLNFETAKVFADFIKEDNTVGGIFPEGNTEKHDEVKFKEKWCKIWFFANPILNIAKLFTDDKVDAIIDALLVIGDKTCEK